MSIAISTYNTTFTKKLYYFPSLARCLSICHWSTHVWLQNILKGFATLNTEHLRILAVFHSDPTITCPKERKLRFGYRNQLLKVKGKEYSYLMYELRLPIPIILYFKRDPLGTLSLSFFFVSIRVKQKSYVCLTLYPLFYLYRG